MPMMSTHLPDLQRIFNSIILYKSSCPKVHRFMSHLGRRDCLISSLVPATSLGILLSLYAPARMLYWCIADTPDRLLRMLPVSLMVSGPRYLGVGGAKSKAVNVLDLRSWCLKVISLDSRIWGSRHLRARHGRQIVERGRQRDMGSHGW